MEDNIQYYLLVDRMHLFILKDNLNRSIKKIERESRKNLSIENNYYSDVFWKWNETMAWLSGP